MLSGADGEPYMLDHVAVVDRVGDYTVRLSTEEPSEDEKRICEIKV